MKVTNAPATSVLARAAILFAALSALCLLLAGCASEGAGTSPAKVAAASPAVASPVVASTAAVSARGVAGDVFGRTGRVAFAVPLPGADSSGAVASADGKTLIVSEAREGAGAVQRRDPATGRLIASHPMAGASGSARRTATPPGTTAPPRSRAGCSAACRCPIRTRTT